MKAETRVDELVVSLEVGGLVGREVGVASPLRPSRAMLERERIFANSSNSASPAPLFAAASL